MLKADHNKSNKSHDKVTFRSKINGSVFHQHMSVGNKYNFVDDLKRKLYVLFRVNQQKRHNDELSNNWWYRSDRKGFY